MIRLYEHEKDYLNEFWQLQEESKEAVHRSSLGNFINIVIENIGAARKLAEYNSQYFSILSRFASLGQQARLYLLKAKIIGRLMIYIKEGNYSSEISSIFGTLNYMAVSQPEVGLPFKLENVKLSLWEELFITKRDAQIADASQDYTFLFETLSWCVRSCVFSTDECQTFVDDLRYTELDRRELQLLGFDDKDLFALISSCQNKIAAKHLGSILIHL